MTNYQTTEAYAYSLGVSAALAGKLVAANPYEKGSASWHRFNEGHGIACQSLERERFHNRPAQTCGAKANQ
jgi:hypothetical protein